MLYLLARDHKSVVSLAVVFGVIPVDPYISFIVSKCPTVLQRAIGDPMILHTSSQKNECSTSQV